MSEGMTSTERKRAQRKRDKLAGWVELTIRVGRDQAQAVRDFAASLPPPGPVTDPNQLSLLAQLDQLLDGDASRPIAQSRQNAQGSLF